MKQQRIIFSIASICMLSSSIIHAAEAKFSIIPTADSITSILVPINFTETVSYVVTNNTKLTRTLTMVPITGVSQTIVGVNACANPFTLAPQQSCTLNLIIDGSKVPTTGIHTGPVICKTQGPNNNTPDPFLCSQPNPYNALTISSTSTPGQHAYIANQLGNSVSFCQTNPVTGLFSQCAVTATGLTGVEAIGFNPAGTLFYSANLIGNNISVCQFNQTTGALSNCVDAGGAGFSQPDGVAFSPDGSIFYTSNVGNTVTACLVNAITGQLSACTNNSDGTFNGASDIALNAAGTLAYVSNRFGNTVSVCNVNQQTVGSCNDLSGSLINAPEGITLDASGLHAYIANAGDGKVIVCDVLQDGTGLLANCSATNNSFAGTGNVAFNNINSFAFIPNANPLINQVFVCAVATDGSLSSCSSSRGTGFIGPAGITIK